MTSNLQFDIAIVGGGLIGATLARALEYSGLSIALIDQGLLATPSGLIAPTREGATLHSGIEPRVTAFNSASQALLERVGGWPAQDRTCAFTHMLAWDARGTSKVEFDVDMIDEPALGYIVENRQVLAALHASAAGQSNLSLLFQSEIESISQGGAGYILQLSGDRQVECDLLVGADGGHSTVRKACGIRSLGWSYDQEALVTTIETELPHGFTARQCFTREGPLGILPLPGEQQTLSSIVWSTQQTAALKALDDEALCETLTRATEGILGRVVGVDARFTFPLQPHHAVRYVRPHLALAGDAAHTIHPLAGQGAGLGLADAQALSVILNECRASGQTPGDIKVLKRYERMRQPQNVATAMVMEAFKRIYGPDHPAVNWLRNTGTRFVDRNRFVKAMVMRLAAGR